MSKIKAETELVNNAASTAIAVAEDQTLALSSDLGVDGDWDTSDIAIPYLSIIQKTSESPFPKGNIIWNRDHVIHALGEKPMTVVFLQIRKEYVEDLPFGSDVKPRRFRSKHDAEAAGLYDKRVAAEGDPTYKPECVCLVLVPVPIEYSITPFELLPEEFRIDEKTGWARALWYVRGAGFYNVAKPVATAVTSGHLRDGVFHGKWALSTEYRTFGKNSTYLPKLRATGRVSDEGFQWISDNCL